MVVLLSNELVNLFISICLEKSNRFDGKGNVIFQFNYCAHRIVVSGLLSPV